MRLVPLRGGRKPEVQMSPLIDGVGTNQEQKPPEVKVAVDGTIWIDDQIVPETELEARMRQLVERAPDDGVILKGDKGADYGVVVHVLDVARKVGAKGIQMSADRPKGQ
jgi:biopolymer transport protein ExbD